MTEPVSASANPDIDAIRAEFIRTNAELQRRIWARDPVAWAQERLGRRLWWGQKRALLALRDHRRVAIQSANGIGKTALAAVATGWWLDTHLPGQAFVVTSAATMQQVETRLWREIHRVHEDGKLSGRLNLTSWMMPMASGREEVVAIGVKPADNDPSAIKGVHAPAVLVIFDEAQSMDAGLWSAAGTITTSDQSRFLAIGNPDTPICHFYQVCQPNSGWYYMALSAFDSPNFYTAFNPGTFKPELPLNDIALQSLVNRRFVEDLINDWGLDHPFVISQVWGQFPETSEDTLIRLDWIRRAQQSHLEPSGEIELGVDVGGGIASSVIVVRHGSVATIDRVRATPDTELAAEDIIRAAKVHEPTLIKVDAIGIGNSLASSLISGARRDPVTNRPIILPVIGVNVGGVANDTIDKKRKAKDPNTNAITNPRESFGNLRAEGYWHLRELFRTNAIRIPAGTPDAERLAGELSALKYRTIAGRIYIESKDDMKRRGLRSPDLADALMLAFMQMPVVKKKARATWGSGRLAGRR
jgi:hypothetical protein